jgi:hypothetical protein
MFSPYFFQKGVGNPNLFTVSQMPFFRGFISKVYQKNKVSEGTSKRGSATPTYSRSARCRSFEASSQKFAEKTKFHKALVEDIILNKFVFFFKVIAFYLLLYYNLIFNKTIF